MLYKQLVKEGLTIQIILVEADIDNSFNVFSDNSPGPAE